MPIRNEPWPAGTPCWVDISVPDVPAAKAFYASVLGWSYDDRGSEDFGGYVICQKDGHDAAGLGPAQDEQAGPKWLTYFATDDAEATATAITGAGGSLVLPPMEVGEAGHMAIAADPLGLPFGLWQAGVTTGVKIYNEPGALVWTDAACPEPDRARQFYAEVFGFSYEPVEGADGYTTFGLGSGPLGGLGGSREGDAAGWSTCFCVADTDAAVLAATGQGGKVHAEPMDTPFGRIATVDDPWGARFSVMSS